MREIQIESLEVGTVITRDVYNDLGNIIISEGTEITVRHLEYFKSHGIFNVFIDDSSLDEDDEFSENYRIFTANKYRDLNSLYASVLEALKAFQGRIVKGQKCYVEVLSAELNPLIDRILEDNDILGSMRLLSFRESYHLTHMINVSLFSAMLGKWLEADREMIYNLALSGILHDVGKWKLPTEILDKKDPLTPKELSIAHQHAQLGYEALKDENLSRDILSGILFHHERNDGQGYPKGLREDQIPLFARVIAVVDVFDAVTSDRIYKSSVSAFQAFSIIKEESFSGLDPAITDVFLSNIAAYFINNRVKLSDGRVGEVVYVNKYAIDRPLVKISKSEFVDLSMNYQLEIEEILQH
jgi:HD-GYP domain-containing protein (c-di-GMP phosphodiesterase class II)